MDSHPLLISSKSITIHNGVYRCTYINSLVCSPWAPGDIDALSYTLQPVSVAPTGAADQPVGTM